MINYWCYRIDKTKIDYFRTELMEGRLRQGWGYDAGQDLRNLTFDEGARRNKPMFDKVKKGDILLIPQLPNWSEVALVEATEDWNSGYKYEIDSEKSDYGHIFPAKFLKSFTRTNNNVTGNLRSTLKNPSRFWNINHYQADVEQLLQTPESELIETQNYENRLQTSILTAFTSTFKQSEFVDELYKKLNEQFGREEWEFALVYGLKQLFPFYEVERVGGQSEKNHGTDILIKLPSIINGYQYAIAIQVKDYEGFVSNEVINQINKADYFSNDSIKIIDKIVIITRAKKENNENLVINDSDVKFIFANELKDLLVKIANVFCSEFLLK